MGVMMGFIWAIYVNAHLYSPLSYLTQLNTQLTYIDQQQTVVRMIQVWKTLNVTSEFITATDKAYEVQSIRTLWPVRCSSSGNSPKDKERDNDSYARHFPFPEGSLTE